MTGSSTSDLGTRIIGAARRRARRLKHGMLGTGTQEGSFNGYVEGIAEDGTLRGWVYTRASLKGRVQVAICAGDTMLEAGYADRNRRDVAEAHGCEAECGFLFTLSDLMFSEIQKAGGTVTVRTMGADEQKLGEVVMQTDTADPEPHKNDIRACRFALREYLADLD